QRPDPAPHPPGARRGGEARRGDLQGAEAEPAGDQPPPRPAAARRHHRSSPPGQEQLLCPHGSGRAACLDRQEPDRLTPLRLDDTKHPAIPKQDRRVSLLALRSTVSGGEQSRERASKGAQRLTDRLADQTRPTPTRISPTNVSGP